MSIDDELCEPQTVTEGDRALQLFTDRYELTRLFAEYLNEESPRKTILFFHGDGGNGKSLLLKFLRQRCCKRFLRETWQQLQAIPKAEVAKVAAYIENAIPENYIPVPAVLLDFSQNLIGDRLKSPFDGLLMLRRNLADTFAESSYRLRFPLYDFACVWYFYKTGNLEQAKELLPSDELDFISGIVDAVSDTSYASIIKAGLGIFGKHLGEQVKLYLQTRGLKEEEVKAIQGMKPHTELIDALPRLFAQDLNAAMAQQEELKRIVLFFDAHEAFWGHQRDLPEGVFFQRDEWLRCLLRALDLDAGIVAVVAGREKPRWAEANQSTRIPQQYLDTQLVGHFSAPDARDYLQKADIKDAALQQSLIDYASVAAEEVHPLYLGLCADVVLAARAQGRVLTPDDFPTAPETPDKSKALINRLLRYVDKEVEVAVHALFPDDFYALDNKGMALQRLGELQIQLGEPSAALSSFTAALAAHDSALTFAPDYINALNNKGIALQRLGELQTQLGDHPTALSSFMEALAVYNRALTLAPDEIKALTNKGNALQSLADLQTQLTQHPQALQSYEEANATYNSVLTLAPNDIRVLINKGRTRRSLGDLQTQLAHHSQALQSYQEASTAYDKVLILAPDHICALNNKGIVLSKLSELQIQLAQPSEALRSYKESITVYDSAITIVPNYIYALNNKGLALQSLGDLQAELSQQQDAINSWQSALAAFTRCLEVAPSDEEIRNQRDRLQEFLDSLGEDTPSN